jgi:hypothetical protein
MQEPCFLENYPIPVVIVSNLLTLLIYVIGVYIIFRLSILLVICYVIFILTLEFRLLGSHCVNCYYFGRTCAFGKGRLSSLLFRKGSMERFNEKPITWRDIVPDFIVFFIPMIAGVILLVQEFSWTVFILVLILFLLGFPGNALVRGRLACRYCMQRSIGCPAEQLFDKTKKS